MQQDPDGFVRSQQIWIYSVFKKTKSKFSCKVILYSVYNCSILFIYVSSEVSAQSMYLRSLVRVLPWNITVIILKLEHLDIILYILEDFENASSYFCTFSCKPYMRLKSYSQVSMCNQESV